MATWMLTSNARDEVARQWRPVLTSGDKLASYCLTEPSAGSDAGSLRTTATLDDGMYVLNGSKAFISGAGETQVLAAMARTGGAGPSGIPAFVVPADTPGVTYGREKVKMGWNSRAHPRHHFRECPSACAQFAWQGRRRIQDCHEGSGSGRINIATCSVGAAQGAGAAPGAAQTLKLVNNPIIVASYVSTLEAFLFGAKAGLSPQVMVDAINMGRLAHNGTTRVWLPDYILQDKPFGAQLHLLMHPGTAKETTWTATRSKNATAWSSNWDAPITMDDGLVLRAASNGRGVEVAIRCS